MFMEGTSVLYQSFRALLTFSKMQDTDINKTRTCMFLDLHDLSQCDRKWYIC